MSLSKDFVEFIECLNAAAVEYLLIGGHAVAFHAQPRFTKDIDFWVRPTPENARRVVGAVAAFGFADAGLGESDFAQPEKIVQLGVPPQRIDLVTSVAGVDFEAAWARRVETEYAGARLNVIHLEDLIANKASVGRDQDLLDLKALRAASEG